MAEKGKGGLLRGRLRRLKQGWKATPAAKQPACMRACVRACVHACVRACVLACVRACMHAGVRACVASFVGQPPLAERIRRGHSARTPPKTSTSSKKGNREEERPQGQENARRASRTGKQETIGANR
eukprot:68874-Chlamydomonas_euryale.AAC.6